ncbi:MAG: hypothetical protein JEZ03_05680 [Bacteroidales bacterium]|nr:hypothetical protein [Bacteroidales bacterium]
MTRSIISKAVSLLLAISILSSCATPYYLANNITIDEFNIYFRYSENFTDEVISKSQEKIYNSIDRFNIEDHEFDIKVVNTTSECDMVVDLHNYKYATKGQQLGSLALSIFGIVVLPYAMIAAELPFYVAFWVVPADRTNMNFKLQPGLQHTPTILPANFKTSAGYFRSKEKHIEKHYKKMDDFFYYKWIALEKEYQRNRSL